MASFTVEMGNRANTHEKRSSIAQVAETRRAGTVSSWHQLVI